jgi:L-aspartate oxidase
VPRFLLSEALRGEGAYLRNHRGERFMERYHPLLELAPRDVVARAITREGLQGPVYLDMRHVAAKTDLKTRFPGISKFLAGYGLELVRDKIPVRPAAHYFMGGIKTDVNGTSSLPGLYAAGEAACTGVHGANRLASNSLLEGLVFGALAAEAMVQRSGARDQDSEDGSEDDAEARDAVPKAPAVKVDAAAIERWITELRSVMWKDAGLLRDAAGLKRAQARLEGMMGEIPRGFSRRAAEARNLFLVAGVIVASAAAREESRGAHYRNDFPKKGKTARHSVMEKGKLRFGA